MEGENVRLENPFNDATFSAMERRSFPDDTKQRTLVISGRHVEKV